MAPPSISGQDCAGSSASGAAPITSTSRPRAQGTRKKMNADDAAYHAPPSASAAAGAKRAADRTEGEPRAKRKRVDVSAAAATASASTNGNGTASGGAANGERNGATVNGEGKIQLVDFTVLPLAAIHEYLTQYDLVPDIEPSPLGADDPPPPSALLCPRGQSRRHASTASPAPQLPVTPANRPRRDMPARRRSARLVDVSGAEAVVPILADVHEVHGVLAQVAHRHFREHAVKEVDTLASFMCAVKAKARMGG